MNAVVVVVVVVIGWMFTCQFAYIILNLFLSNSEHSNLPSKLLLVLLHNNQYSIMDQANYVLLNRLIY